MPDFDPYGREQRQQMPAMGYNDPWQQYDQNPWSLNPPAGTTSPLYDALGWLVQSAPYQAMSNMGQAIGNMTGAEGWWNDQAGMQAQQQAHQQYAQQYPPDMGMMPSMPQSQYSPRWNADGPDPSGSLVSEYRQPIAASDIMALLAELSPGLAPQIQQGMGADGWMDYLNNPRLGDYNSQRPGGL
jgi:hypothetical protein